MIEILEVLAETYQKSTREDFVSFINQYPEQLSWHLISDYCFDDLNKQNDTATFSVLLNHDKIPTILDAINSHSPKDLKNTRTINPKFLNYINSKVFFHFTFIFDRKDSFLKDLETDSFAANTVDQFIIHLGNWEKNVPEVKGYVAAVKKRLSLLKNDTKKKSFNRKLFRKMFIISLLSSFLCHELNILSKPKYISWISDRDSIINSFDGVTFDLSFVLMLLFAQDYNNNHIENPVNPPVIKYILPEDGKSNYLDPLIRIPDYLTGTLADLDILKKEFSKDKYYDICFSSLLEAPNHSIIWTSKNKNTLRYSTKRIKVI
ncbi:MAG: hypothetical protein ABUK01_08575 [Leptospirales bacterium]